MVVLEKWGGMQMGFEEVCGPGGGCVQATQTQKTQGWGACGTTWGWREGQGKKKKQNKTAVPRAREPAWRSEEQPLPGLRRDGSRRIGQRCHIFHT